MQFRLLALFLFFGYVAASLAALRSPSVRLVNVTTLLCVFAYASAALYAFDRRHTPVLGFVLFGLLAAFTADDITYVFKPVLDLLRDDTDAISSLQREIMMTNHFSLVVGGVGYCIGHLIHHAKGVDITTK